MKIRVIVLAQGSQQRFTDLAIPKQLLPLDGAPLDELRLVNTVIYRTINQVYVMPWDECHVTVICADPLKGMVDAMAAGAPPEFRGYWWLYATERGKRLQIDTHTLPDPGNSSLKGLYRFLRDDTASLAADATVVLLGDVVYSWNALRALWQAPCSLAFACSSDLSPASGELFGIASNSQAQLFAAVGVAMENHPPKQVDKTYQPGQLRLVLWAIDRAHQWKGEHANLLHVGGDWRPADERGARPWFIPIDDYTRDFDKPADLEFLAPTARAAREDDARSGFTW